MQKTLPEHKRTHQAELIAFCFYYWCAALEKKELEYQQSVVDTLRSSLDQYVFSEPGIDRRVFLMESLKMKRDLNGTLKNEIEIRSNYKIFVIPLREEDFMNEVKYLELGGKFSDWFINSGEKKVR